MSVMAKQRPAKGERPGSLVMTFRCDGELLEAFFDFLDDQRVPPNKSDVISLALQEFFKAEGYYPPKRKRGD